MKFVYFYTGSRIRDSCSQRNKTWWLNSHYCEVEIEGYEIIRLDRNHNGGGVCFYVRNCIDYTVRDDLLCNDLEILTLEIRKPFTNYHLLLQPGIDLQVQEVTSFAFVNQSKSNEERNYLLLSFWRHVVFFWFSKWI